MKTKFEKAEEEIKKLAEADVKQDERNASKFTELYNSRNKTNETLTELTTTIKMLISTMDKQYSSLATQIEKLEQKIDSKG